MGIEILKSEFTEETFMEDILVLGALNELAEALGDSISNPLS